MLLHAARRREEGARAIRGRGPLLPRHGHWTMLARSVHSYVIFVLWLAARLFLLFSSTNCGGYDGTIIYQMMTLNPTLFSYGSGIWLVY